MEQHNIINKNHICVCICTYKRPELLERLLLALQNQETKELFNYSIVVVDNDQEQSAQVVVENIQKNNTIKYLHEPQKNIAIARNKAVTHAHGEFIALIDDDEFPKTDWLLNLYQTLEKYKVDGILGPVKPYFDKTPPRWLVKSKLCERPTHETGKVLDWDDTRTGNVLIRRKIFNEKENLFDPDFAIQGEDKDFFRRMTARGYVFIWCNEAPVYETVPPDRWKKTYFLKRAFIQGNASFKYYGSSMNLKLKLKIIIKSILASFVYTFMLPVLSLFWNQYLIKYLAKDIYHLSLLLTVFGLINIKERNI